MTRRSSDRFRSGTWAAASSIGALLAVSGHALAEPPQGRGASAPPTLLAVDRTDDAPTPPAIPAPPTAPSVAEEALEAAVLDEATAAAPLDAAPQVAEGAAPGYVGVARSKPAEASEQAAPPADAAALAEPREAAQSEPAQSKTAQSETEPAEAAPLEVAADDGGARDLAAEPIAAPVARGPSLELVSAALTELFDSRAPGFKRDQLKQARADYAAHEMRPIWLRRGADGGLDWTRGLEALDAAQTLTAHALPVDAEGAAGPARAHRRGGRGAAGSRAARA